MWTTVLFAASTALFLLLSVKALVAQRWAYRLPPWRDFPPRAISDAGLVHCSVVVPVRDEEARVGETIRRLLEQRGVTVELIVVDDRSTDRTAEILDRLASAEPRVRIASVASLPHGWLGKCHACHIGAATANGEWILFTDADCWLKPDVIARAVLIAERERVDHVTLTPGVAARTVAARAWHLAFLSRLSGWIAGVNRDRPGAYIGFGAFNLVRASAYHACGGYEALRLTVVDDVKFGLLLQRAGKRTRAFIGGDDVECHWGTTVPDMIRVMEKNYFAAANFRSGTVAAATVIATLMLGAAIAGPFTRTVAGIAPGLAFISLALPAAIFARRLGWSLTAAAIAPLLYPCLIYAFARSAFLTLRRGGVQWRDRFYPLEMLRNGTVR